MKLVQTLTLIACTAFSFFMQAQSTVHYVTPTGSGNATGTSWANASGDLFLTLNNANAGDEIWVAQGTYTPVQCTSGCSEADRMTSFPLKEGVSLIGGFLGTETLRVQASPSNLTILSGDIGVQGNTSDNSYNIVECDKCGSTSGLENFTLTGANGNRAAGSGPNQIGRAGGALYLNGFGGIANPVVTSCTFSNNNVIGRGGALFCNGVQGGQSSPLFRFCTFDGNSSNAEGGAVAIDGTAGTANPKFDDCSFTNNQTIYAAGVTQAGGAVYCVAQAGIAIVDFNRCLFQGNRADANTAGGTNDNTSGLGGAMYFTSSGVGSLELNLYNSILDNNTAFSAGAIYNLGGMTTLEEVTMTNNSATGNGGSGGGLYVNGGSAAIVNSISFDNTVPANPFGGLDIRFVNGTVDIAHSLVEAADEGTLFSRASSGNTDVLNAGPGMIYGTNPELSAPNGYPEIGAATSPAINAGLNSAITSTGGDYTGASRINDGIVDLGATESLFAPLPVELISFSAKALDSKIRLDWEVASEVDLEGYKLLRRAPDGGFDEIIFVPAMESGSYYYEDAAVVPTETYYYVLVSQDFDGTTYDSDLVTARIEAVPTKEIVSNLYPNPTSGLLNIQLSPREGARTVYAVVLNMNGQRMMFNSYTKDGTYQFDLRDLPNGNYIVRLTEGDLTQTEMVTVQH